MHTDPQFSGILAINGGSSSIKFALYQLESQLERKFHGKIDRIGLSGTMLTFQDDTSTECQNLPILTKESTVEYLIKWLEEQKIFPSLRAVGHRVVHGMQHSKPARVTRELLDELDRFQPYDPDHLPREIELMEAFQKRDPDLPQMAYFDTAFHRSMPRVARQLALPRRYEDKGVQRYGFHGLSYAFLMEELGHLDDPVAATGRVILAHLGNGASLAAVQNGKSIDTSMGFTPASGLMMSTRAGDLDPGLVRYLANTEQMMPEEFDRMINHESGLLGISETSPDLRDLLARESEDTRAAEAVALFCYHVKKWIGSFAAALGGLDTLVFAGGIGENAPLIRQRICDGLGFLGIELDEKRNTQNAPLISLEAGRVAVRVIPTNEELMIARSVCRDLALDAVSTTQSQP